MDLWEVAADWAQAAGVWRLAGEALDWRCAVDRDTVVAVEKAQTDPCVANLCECQDMPDKGQLYARYHIPR